MSKVMPHSRTTRAARGLGLVWRAQEERWQARSEDDKQLAERFDQRAVHLECSAAALLSLDHPPDKGTGGELRMAPGVFPEKPGIVDTANRPDAVTVEASQNRMELAADAGALVLAADAAESIQARNSLERMLAHQLAAAHAMAMRITARLDFELSTPEYASDPSARREANVEIARLANANARMMRSFQEGLLTLDRLRHGGQQVVTVQHVSVSDGGQAVVAGNVERGGNDGGS